jgi:protein-export membrane protein SecD
MSARGFQLLGCVVAALLLFLSGCDRPPRHGVQFLVQLDINPTNTFAEKEQLYAQTQDALRRRLEPFVGRSGPVFQPAQSNQLQIQLPGLEARARPEVQHRITNVTSLEFRLVHQLSDELVKKGAETPAGYERIKSMEHAVQSLGTMIVQKPVDGLNSRSIKTAAVERDPLGRPQIVFQLQPEATELFAALTRDNIGRRLAIVLNGVVYSAPIINTPIEKGSVAISGNFSDAEAFELAATLGAPLPVTVTILDERTF